MKHLLYFFCYCVCVMYVTTSCKKQPSEDTIAQNYMQHLDSLKNERRIAIQDSLNSLPENTLFRGIKFGISESAYNKEVKSWDKVRIEGMYFFPDAYFDNDSLYHFELRCSYGSDDDDSRMVQKIKDILIDKYGEPEGESIHGECYTWKYKQRYIYLRNKRTSTTVDGELYCGGAITIEYEYPPHIQAEEKRLEEIRKQSARENEKIEIQEAKDKQEL